MSISKIFIPNFVRVLTNKRNILNRIFILLLGSAPGVGLGGAGGSKILARGFAMAPHRLRILVNIIITNDRLFINYPYITCLLYCASDVNVNF